MHLKLLENYIVQLGIRRINSSSSAFIDTDEVIKDLMEILIQEESLIPDFVIDGDTMVNPQRQLIGIDHGFYDYDREAEDDYFFGDDSFFDNEDAEYELRRYGDRMKKIAIVLLGVSIGLVGFIVGFFAA